MFLNDDVDDVEYVECNSGQWRVLEHVRSQKKKKKMALQSGAMWCDGVLLASNIGKCLVIIVKNAYEL